MKTIIKRFDIQVDQALGQVKAEFELEKTVERIGGLLLSADRDDLLFYRGSQKIEIGGREIFPEEYESKLLMSGISLKPNDRFFSLDAEPGNGMVSLAYQDSDHPQATFTPYRVSLYLKLLS